MPTTNQKPPWGVILAGGDGTRLRPLTRLISGDARPKQFCKILDGETLLAHTRLRILKAIPEERTLFVLRRSHEKFYSTELADVPKGRLLVQPANKGTGAAIACAVVRILQAESDALVAFFPADHHYDNEGPFVQAIQDGFEIAARNPSSLILLGAEANYAETEYGWIEPGAGSSECRMVSRFWEKPSPGHAQELLRRGCLWNTFIMIGRASAFRDVLDAAVPGVVRAFASAFADGEIEERRARDLYSSLAAVDFSRQVLSMRTDRLQVLKLANAGWSDLGKPERVMAVLARAGIRPRWEAGELQSNKAIA